MTDLREVRVVETCPLFFSGELAENEVEAMEQRYGKAQRIWVMDRGTWARFRLALHLAGMTISCCRILSLYSPVAFSDMGRAPALR